MKPKTEKRCWIVLLTTSTVMVLLSFVAIWMCFQVIQAERRTRYAGVVNVAAEKIAKTIRGMEMNAMNEFDEVEKHLDTPESVVAALESKTSLNPEVRGYFAAFEPGYFPQKGQWFEPYVHHVDSGDFVVRNVGSVRHNYHKSDWYIRAKVSNESFWSDPYYYYDGTSISGHYTTFVKPVYDRTGRLACVCGADMTFEWLAKELERIDEEVRNDNLLNSFFLSPDTLFYTIVINQDGSCIANQNGKKAALTKERVGSSVDLTKRGVVSLTVQGVPSTAYYAPIEHVNWAVAVVAPDKGVFVLLLKPSLVLLLITIVGILVIWFICKRFRHGEAD